MPTHTTVNKQVTGSDCVGCGVDEYVQYGFATGVEFAALEAFFVSAWGSYVGGTVNGQTASATAFDVELGVDLGNQRDLLVQLRWKPTFVWWSNRDAVDRPRDGLEVAWYGHGEVRIGRPTSWHILGANARPTPRDHRLAWLGWGWKSKALRGETGIAVPGVVIEPSGDPLTALPVELYAQIQVSLSARLSLDVGLELGGLIAAYGGITWHFQD